METIKKHIVEVDSIQYEIAGNALLRDIYLKCETGSITALIGRNGTGKSTLFKIIYGVLSCESSVRFNQASVKESFKYPHLITFLPQFNFIPSSISIQKVLLNFNLKLDDFLLFLPNFQNRMKEKMGNLSGGEKRMIEVFAIAKSNAQFSILDEPFTFLSPLQIEKVKELILSEKFRKGFIITDHLQQHVLEIQNRLYLLHNCKTHFLQNVNEIEKYGYSNM